MTMERTTIMLSAELKEKAVSRAREMKISLGKLIRRSIEHFINEKNREYLDDPFFADSDVFQGNVEEDLALNHDNYLYGEEKDDIH
jgi:hypothetical protein